MAVVQSKVTKMNWMAVVKQQGEELEVMASEASLRLHDLKEGEHCVASYVEGHHTVHFWVPMVVVAAAAEEHSTPHHVFSSSS